MKNDTNGIKCEYCQTGTAHPWDLSEDSMSAIAKNTFMELLDYRDSDTVRIEHFDGFGHEEFSKAEIELVLKGFSEQN